MRGGSYGWQAADAGVIGICWTNTLPTCRRGAPPIRASATIRSSSRCRGAAGHVVLDMAMSQFSVGALASYRSRGELLPVPGGYDAAGRAHAAIRRPIEASGRLLPVGFWKGSGLSLMLDLVAALLSGGQATHEIPLEPELETGLSQVFLAIDPSTLGPDRDGVADAVLAHVHAGDGDVRSPGERVLETRETSLRDGVPGRPGHLGHGEIRRLVVRRWFVVCRL